MTENLANVPAVWVLIFDRYLGDVASEESGGGPSTRRLTPATRQGNIDAFDRLDLESTCFEQFLLQNVRSKISAEEVFGGEPAFRKLAEAMTAAKQTVSLVRLTVEDAVFVDHGASGQLESVLRGCGMPLRAVIELDFSNAAAAASAATSDDGLANLDPAFQANLVWIEVSIVASANAANEILDTVLRRRQSCSIQDGRSPVLIVTFRTGADRDVREPFKSGIAEDRMHVPLWIQPHPGHACRVQALAGSFDLLPTIETFLGSVGASAESRPPDVAQIADSSERLVAAQKLSSAQRSLAFLCGAPQVCPNRLLLLHGDGWKGARTEEFLLVISEHHKSEAEKTETNDDDATEPSRRLFVKPEDRYNVNDVSGTYATAVDELARLMP